MTENSIGEKEKLQPVFVKHYAPNIYLSLNMCVVFPQKILDLTVNLLIIPYQLTKFQNP